MDAELYAALSRLGLSVDARLNCCGRGRSGRGPSWPRYEWAGRAAGNEPIGATCSLTENRGRLARGGHLASIGVSPGMIQQRVDEPMGLIPTFFLRFTTRPFGMPCASRSRPR